MHPQNRGLRNYTQLVTEGGLENCIWMFNRTDAYSFVFCMVAPHGGGGGLRREREREREKIRIVYATLFK
jgi:hypothetical protein